jgi:hypothetical protein
MILLVAACNGLPETDDFSPDAGDSAIARTNPPPVCPILYPTVTHGGGTIRSPETWRNNTIHIVTGDVAVQAALTLGTCARVQLAAGKSIDVDATGSLTAQTGVTLQPNDPTPWGRLRIQGGAVTLNTTTIAGAGSSAGATLPAVSLSAGTLNIQGLQITSSVGLGLEVTGGAIDPTSTTLTVSGAGAAPVSIPANMVGQLPVGSYTGNATDEIVVPIGVVSVSQTWRNVGVPYHISGGLGATLNVTAPIGVAVLTIDPGTTLRFDPDTGMRIDPVAGKQTAASGALHAVGLGTQPITFTAAIPSQPWMALFFGGAIDANTQISQARIEFAGGADQSQFASCPTPFTPNQFNNPAAIRFESGPPPAQSFISFTTIANSAANGIDRGFKLLLGQTSPDFSTNNVFDSVPFCAQTHTKSSSNGCPTPPECN